MFVIFHATFLSVCQEACLKAVAPGCLLEIASLYLNACIIDCSSSSLPGVIMSKTCTRPQTKQQHRQDRGDGQQRQTHDSTGVIHIEAPGQQSFSLNEFFQEWSTRFPQMTYPNELDSTSGWVVYVDGKPYKGDFHTIPLVAHTLITLAYNSPGVKP